MRFGDYSCSDNGRYDHTNLLHYGRRSYLLLPYGGMQNVQDFYLVSKEMKEKPISRRTNIPIKTDFC